MCGEIKSVPFSDVINYSRVWRKGARKRGSVCGCGSLCVEIIGINCRYWFESWSISLNPTHGSLRRTLI